jgi:hypothetical protein
MALNRGHTALAVIWALNAVAGLFLAIRLYSKARRGKGLWWDDYIMVAAAVGMSNSYRRVTLLTKGSSAQLYIVVR